MSIQELTSQSQLNNILSSETTTVIIDFYATWCGPCKRIAPAYQELFERYSSDSIIFCKANVDECSELVDEYNIKPIPAFVVVNKSFSTQILPSKNNTPLAELEKNIMILSNDKVTISNDF